MSGRFAPSPTGPLHLGSLRTAVVAWLAARSTSRGFLVRVEDLDPVNSSTAHERRQLADLALLGVDWDGTPVRQSDRFDLYRDAIGRLDREGLLYRCWCTRREIQQAAVAPHGDPVPDGAYPGTCRTLSAAAEAEHVRAGRRPALRLRAQVDCVCVSDAIAGEFTGGVDDVVVQRNDGVPAYNLAVVVDDGLQGVTQVVRGDDLLASTPRQVHLQQLLGIPTPEYAHVPLVLGPDGIRLAKRHGAVTLADLGARGRRPAHVLAAIAASLGLGDEGEELTIADLLPRFSFGAIPRAPWQPNLELV